MSEKQKSPYHIKAQEDLQRNQKEMNELMTKGFFVNQDGIKSTDLVNKKKRSAVTSKGQEHSPTTSKRKAMTEPIEPQEEIVKKSPKRAKK